MAQEKICPNGHVISPGLERCERDNGLPVETDQDVRTDIIDEHEGITPPAPQDISPDDQTTPENSGNEDGGGESTVPSETGSEADTTDAPAAPAEDAPVVPTDAPDPQE